MLWRNALKALLGLGLMGPSNIPLRNSALPEVTRWLLYSLVRNSREVCRLPSEIDLACAMEAFGWSRATLHTKAGGEQLAGTLEIKED